MTGEFQLQPSSAIAVEKSEHLSIEEINRQLEKIGLYDADPRLEFRKLLKSAKKNPQHAGLLRRAALADPKIGEIAVSENLTFKEFNHKDGSGIPVLCGVNKRAS